jgi:hypothetical protein
MSREFENRLRIDNLIDVNQIDKECPWCKALDHSCRIFELDVGCELFVRQCEEILSADYDSQAYSCYKQYNKEVLESKITCFT